MSTTNFNYQEKSNISVNDAVLIKNNDQYINLNLNETFKSPIVINSNSNYDHSISNSNNENGRKNIDNTNFNNKLQSKNISLNNSILQPIILNLKNGKSEEGKESQKTLTTNSSTLSLHISAYENSIEASNLNTTDDESSTIKTKKTFGKSCKNVNELLLNGSSSCTPDPFAFSRQQKPEEEDPEVLQFKASQKLFNPKESNNDESGGGDNASRVILEDDDATKKQQEKTVVEIPNIDKIELGGGDEEYELEEGEIVDGIGQFNIKIKLDKDSTATIPTIKISLEADVDFPITKHEEPQMPHYENITEQMPKDDFVTSLLSQIGQQFCVEPALQQIRLRIVPPLSTLNTTLERVESHRMFKIGNDKKGKSQARVWIDTPQDDTRVFLYRHSEQDSDGTKEVFVCIQCSLHNRVTKFEVRRVQNSDQKELWEQPTHYPSCSLNKAAIEKIQLRRSLNVKDHEASNRIMKDSLTGTSNENSFDNSFYGSAPTNASSTSLMNSSSRSAGRPKYDYHYQAHRIAPNTDIFAVYEKGPLKTRIVVPDEYNRNHGRGVKTCLSEECKHKFTLTNESIRHGDNFAGELTIRELLPYGRDAPCHQLSLDEIIDLQMELKIDEKLPRKETSMYAFSNINEANMPSNACSSTIAIRFREATQSPSIEEEEDLAERRTRASRSRSRSPTNGSSTSFLNSSGDSARRGRRPDKSLMRIVPNTMWRFDFSNDPGIGSKLLIFTDLDASMGREFVFGEFGLDGGAYYNCQQCLRLTANRQRTKGYVAIESGGQIEVREGKHYPTYRPFILRNISPLLPQNPFNDAIAMEIIEDQLQQVVKVNRSPMKPAATTVLVAEEAYPSLSPELGTHSSSSTRKQDDNEPLSTPSPIQSLNQTSFTDPTAAVLSTIAIESGGQIEVREGKHYPTYRPFILRNISPLLPQNPFNDAIAMESIEDPLNQVVKINRSFIKPVATTAIVAEEAPLLPELGAPSSSTTRKRDDNEPLSTPSPIQSLNQTSFTDLTAAAVSTILAQTINFVPEVLTRDKTVFYNVPSSSQMRNASKILGVEYIKDGHVFWNNTLQWISEFRGSSRPAEIRPITMQRFSGFASLAIFVTGNEEYGFEIQRAIKTYFYQNYVNGKNCKLSEDVVLEAFVSNELKDIHLSIFSRMINCIVGVFDGPLLKIYGSSDYEQSPTMLLKKNDKIFSPVVRIHP